MPHIYTYVMNFNELRFVFFFFFVCGQEQPTQHVRENTLPEFLFQFGIVLSTLGTSEGQKVLRRRQDEIQIAHSHQILHFSQNIVLHNLLERHNIWLLIRE